MSASISAMSDPSTTPWFDGDLSPARPGVYARRAPAGPFACWDGERWRADAPNAAAAARQAGGSRFAAAPWRGLTSPPDAPCATCRGHTVLDRGVDVESGGDLIEECPDC